MEHPQVIDDLPTLAAWQSRLVTTLRPHSLPEVEFRLREFSDAHNRGFSAFAASMRRACGCAASGFFATVVLATTVIGYFGAGRHIADLTLRDATLALGSVLLAALVGKALGLAWARWRLLRLAYRIRDTVREAPRRSITQST